MFSKVHTEVHSSSAGVIFFRNLYYSKQIGILKIASLMSLSQVLIRGRKNKVQNLTAVWQYLIWQGWL